jgi:hypothetical protein
MRTWFCDGALTLMNFRVPLMWRISLPAERQLSAAAAAATWNYCVVPHDAIPECQARYPAMLGELAGLLINSARHLFATSRDTAQ